MLAKQLSHTLTRLSQGSDVTPDNALDMEQRFESLRGYNRLPRGRENRGRPLTDKQIVAAVLGLVASRPNWAGHVCAIIERLKPVGGKADAFGVAATLTDALSFLLTDAVARASIVAVRLSVAEIGTNSNGMATMTFEDGGTRRVLSFVRDEAVSIFFNRAWNVSSTRKDVTRR